MTDVHKIFQEIEEKSKDGDYIYRGEPKCYENVSSRLWRKFAKYDEDCNVMKVQNELFDGIKQHVPTPNEKEMDILSEVQHYGGDTNLIDFTTNYLIALFFACEQQFDENGRVILQDRDKKTGMIVEPIIPHNARDSQHRIVIQKSVFVQKPEGFFNPQQRNVVTICAHQKKDIMSYLEKYHDISISTVYNDLHGYIKYQDFHGGGYTQYYAGVASMNKGNYEMAVEHFTRAINSNYFTAKTHYYRGRAYTELEEYDRSIKDYSAALESIKDDPILYMLRGTSYLLKEKQEVGMALEDFDSAINLDDQNDQALAWRGTIYHKIKNDRKQALSDYDNSIRLNPDGSPAYYFRAVLYYDMDKEQNNDKYWVKAFEDFKRAANMDPSIENEIPKDIKRVMGLTQSLRDSAGGRDITGRRITTT